MDISVSQFDPDTYKGSIPVTRTECDYARNLSKYPLKHGARSAGTTYDETSNTYELSVLADTPEQVQKSLELWVREIHSQHL
jgi:hypothetical protein